MSCDNGFMAWLNPPLECVWWLARRGARASAHILVLEGELFTVISCVFLLFVGTIIL